MPRRRNVSAEARQILEQAREQARQHGLEQVENIVTEYLEGDDAAELQREDPGEYMARWADDVWEMSDVYFDDERDAAAAYEILNIAALQLGGDPRYARAPNPARQRKARDTVRRHTADKRWKQRIRGGTKRAPATFERQSLIRGAMVELEHTTDPLTALEIAMDHLDEDPDYYGKLATIHHNPSAGQQLGRWAWCDPQRCGTTPPSAAARELAKRRWTLPERERRIAARILRS